MWTCSVALRFNGDHTFDDNWALVGGAIFIAVEASIFPPEDGGELIFQNLRGEVSGDTLRVPRWNL